MSDKSDAAEAVKRAVLTWALTLGWPAPITIGEIATVFERDEGQDSGRLVVTVAVSAGA